jgi:hypothetical protein
MVLVALAGTGGTPVNISAGKATKLPPPATALMAPPSAPAKKRKMALVVVKKHFYHDSGVLLHFRLGLGFKSFLDNALLCIYERVHPKTFCNEFLIRIDMATHRGNSRGRKMSKYKMCVVPCSCARKSACAWKAGP